MQPPSGIHIKGADPNTQTFPGKEVCIQWNPVGAGTFVSEIVQGYVGEGTIDGNDLIEIVHTQDPKELMIVNENGIALGLKKNPAASIIAGQPILGTAVLFAAKDFYALDDALPD